MAEIISITDFSAPELDVYARLTEGQLFHYYEPDTGIFIAESPNVILRALNAGYQPLSLLMEEKHAEGAGQDVIARCGSVPVFTAPFDILTKLTGFQLTRGALCAMRRRPLPPLSSILGGMRRIAGQHGHSIPDPLDLFSGNRRLMAGMRPDGSKTHGV